ncbi:hypothetical protein [Polyangium aurulentum]|uniref:hypothetical protein n=1 Tax=Polyangium aurulentum TaxID=2567896 RepID=UPI0010AE3FC0|nr:hypothetical protein [Polyangium aurulentum]UQA54562.1 hypothetical protein E8A73_024635 [Polyangium aurulentum]
MHVEPSVEVVDSPRVEHTRPGLGRMLARVSGACLFGTPLILVVLFSTLSRALLNGLFWAGIAGALLSALSSVLCSSMSWPRPRGAVLRASEEGLIIEREGQPPVSIARDRIESGMVISGVPHFRLMIQLRNGDVITADTLDETLAQRALAILGVSADVRRVAVQLGTANRQILAAAISLPLTALFAGGLGVIGIMRWQSSGVGPAIDVDVLFSAIWVLFTGLLTYLIVSSFRPTEVIVGSDRIRVQGVHRHEFPHSAIKRAEAHGKKLFLILRGSSTSVPYVAASGEPGVVAGLAERINEAVARARKGPEERPVAGLLDPAGRPLSAWRDALRALVPDAGYRTSGVTRESLIEVLEDPAAPPGRRIGAALALRGSEHPESKARIRIVADACVDDALRQALEEAAEDELAENTLRRVLR